MENINQTGLKNFKPNVKLNQNIYNMQNSQQTCTWQINKYSPVVSNCHTTKEGRRT